MAILPNLDWKNEGEATSNSPRLDANRMQQLWDQARSAMTAPIIDGTQLITNNANCIQLDDKDILKIKSTGIYYTINCSNTPTGQNGYLFVYAYTDSLVIIEFENGGNNSARYQRKLINGTWQDWVLIEGETVLTTTTMSVGGSGVTIPLMKAYSKLRVFVNGIGYVDLTPTGMDANGNYNRFAGAGRPLASDGTTVYTEVVVSVDYTGTSGLVKLLKAKSSSYAAIANIESSTNKQITSIRGIV